MTLTKNTPDELTKAAVVRLFKDAGLTIDFYGSLRVTHETGTFCLDEDDSGACIIMHQDTIDANEKYRVEKERRAAEEEVLKAEFLKTDKGKEWVKKTSFPIIDVSGSANVDLKNTWANCKDLSGGKPWLT